jgi:hypothetical protein
MGRVHGAIQLASLQDAYRQACSKLARALVDVPVQRMTPYGHRYAITCASSSWYAFKRAVISLNILGPCIAI